MRDYPGLQVDHIFKIVKDDAEALSNTEKLDCRHSRVTKHSGQGTSSRFIFLEKNYLEYIYVDDRKSAESSWLKFHRRYESALDGGMPYGIGFRGELTEEELVDFDLYESSWSKDIYEIWVHRESYSDLKMPMLFYLKDLRAKSMEDYYPSLWAGDRKPEIADHLNLNAINEVDLFWPGLSEFTFAQVKGAGHVGKKALINGDFEF